MPYKSATPNVFTENLPPALKGLIESLFPPDSLGIDPGSGLMPVAPLLGAMGKVAPQGIQAASRAPRAPVEGIGKAMAGLERPMPSAASAGRAAEMAGDWSGSYHPQIREALSEIAPSTGHGIPDYVPVGGEAAFNAARTPKLGTPTINQDPVLEALGRWKGEMGESGLRNLQRQPIPQRLVQAPPRLK